MADEALLLTRRLEREKKARAQAEAIAEQRSRDLYLQAHELDQRNADLGHALERMEAAFARLSEAESEVRRERDFVAHLLDTARVAVVVVDAEQRIVQANGFAAALAGSSPDELRGREMIGTLFAREQALEAADVLRDASTEPGRTLALESSTGVMRMIEWCRSELTASPSGSRTLLLVGHDVTERVRLFRELQELSNTDPLTGLANRRSFEGAARREIARAIRHSRPLATVMIDVDHFKRVNDTWGHAVGDQVLKSVASACDRGVRATDLRARIGGEEFCLLLPETDAAGAVVVAERLRASIESTHFEHEGTEFRVTASFGVASLSEGGTLESSLADADRALYTAKSHGRNQVVVAS